MDLTVQQQVHIWWLPSYCPCRKGPQKDHNQQVSLVICDILGIFSVSTLWNNWCIFVLTYSWEDVIEQQFSVQLVPGRHKIVAPETDCVALLREIPPNWSLDHDESLVHLMSQHIPPENNHLGSIKNFVESVNVSTFGVSFVNMTWCDYLLSYEFWSEMF